MSSSSLKRKSLSNEQDEYRKHPRLDLEIPTAASSIDINKFPYEMRLKIYEWAVGNRTIHVRSKIVTKGGKDYTRVFHNTCRCPWSETEIYNACAKPDASPDAATPGKTFLYPHKRCGHGPENCSHLNKGFPTREPLPAVDLSILATSSEAKVEGRKLFYSTNTFSFERENLLSIWLRSVPPDMKPWVRSVHLRTSVCESEIRKFIAQLTTELPNLKTLHISIVWYGFVTCNRLMGGKCNIPEVFRPLRQLQKLKTFTVVMHDVLAPTMTGCPGWEHDEATHDGDMDYMDSNLGREHVLWEYHGSANRGRYLSKEDKIHNVEARKELCRVWAEEIRDVVLSPEVEDREDS